MSSQSSLCLIGSSSSGHQAVRVRAFGGSGFRVRAKRKRGWDFSVWILKIYKITACASWFLQNAFNLLALIYYNFWSFPWRGVEVGFFAGRLQRQHFVTVRNKVDAVILDGLLWRKIEKTRHYMSLLGKRINLGIGNGNAGSHHRTTLYTVGSCHVGILVITSSCLKKKKKILHDL